MADAKRPSTVQAVATEPDAGKQIDGAQQATVVAPAQASIGRRNKQPTNATISKRPLRTQAMQDSIAAARNKMKGQRAYQALLVRIAKRLCVPPALRKPRLERLRAELDSEGQRALRRVLKQGAARVLEQARMSKGLAELKRDIRRPSSKRMASARIGGTTVRRAEGGVSVEGPSDGMSAIREVAKMSRHSSRKRKVRKGKRGRLYGIYVPSCPLCGRGAGPDGNRCVSCSMVRRLLVPRWHQMLDRLKDAIATHSAVSIDQHLGFSIGTHMAPGFGTGEGQLFHQLAALVLSGGEFNQIANRFRDRLVGVLSQALDDQILAAAYDHEPVFQGPYVFYPTFYPTRGDIIEAKDSGRRFQVLNVRELTVDLVTLVDGLPTKRHSTQLIKTVRRHYKRVGREQLPERAQTIQTARKRARRAR